MKKSILGRIGVVFTVFLLIVMMVTTGCSSNKPAPVTNTPPASSGTANEAPALDLDAAAAYYKGKTVSFIVPYAAGGGYDINARILAPYLEKYTGARFIIQNVEGAGGLLGTNQIYMAPNNGLTIGIINAVGCATNEIIEVQGISYDLLKFGWIGRIATDVRCLVVRSDYKYQTIEEILSSGETLKVAATGVGGSLFVDAVISAYGMDLDMNLISGYDSSSNVDMGLLRGEVDAAWGSYPSRLTMIKNGEQIPVLQNGYERSPQMPDIPTWFEVAKSDERKAALEILQNIYFTGRCVTAPPGLAPERLAFLQEAFQKAFDDPEFVHEMENAGMEMGFLHGSELFDLFERTLNIPEGPAKDVFIRASKGEM